MSCYIPHVRLNDGGAVWELRVWEPTVNTYGKVEKRLKDITGATDITFKFRQPDKTTWSSLSGTLSTDGSDSLIRCVVPLGHWSLKGRWWIMGRYTLNGQVLSTTPRLVHVEDAAP